MWASCRSQDVVCSLHVRHPVPDGLRGGVLEGGSATQHRPHLSTAQAHAEHIEGLALHVLWEDTGTDRVQGMQAKAR